MVPVSAAVGCVDQSVMDLICFYSHLHILSNDYEDTKWYRHHAVYEIIWKNSVEPERPQMTIRRTVILHWIRKVTDLQPEYVTHCSSTARMVAQTYFSFTLYVHYLA